MRGRIVHLVRNNNTQKEIRETLKKLTEETLKAAKKYAEDQSDQHENEQRDISEADLKKIRAICGNEFEPIRYGVTRLMQGQVAIVNQMEKLLNGDKTAFNRLKDIETQLGDQANFIMRNVGGLKEVNKHLEKIQEFSAQKQNILIQEFKQFHQEIKQLQDSETIRQKKEAFNQTIQSYQTAFQLCGALGEHFDNKSLQTVGELGFAATQLYAAGTELLTVGFAMGPAALAGIAALSIVSVLSNKKKNQADPFASIILHNLHVISEQIYHVHQEIRELRQETAENQLKLLQVISEGFSTLEEVICCEIRDFRIATTETLERIESSLNQWGITLSDGQKNISLQPFDKLLSRMNDWLEKREVENPEAEIPKLANRAHDWLNEYTKSILYTGMNLVSNQSSNLDIYRHINEVIFPQVSENTVSEKRGFLAYYATQVLGAYNHAPSVRTLGTLWMDRVSYNYPQYYGTIRTEVMTIDGQQKLFAMIRQAGGLELHQYDPSINMWQRLAWLTHWTDSVGYNNPQYYETICTEVITINNQQKLLAMIRNASGLQLNLYDPLTNTWQGLATGPAWADSGGYYNPTYYKTIRTNIITINGQQKLLAMIRNASGLQLNLYDPLTNLWQELAAGPEWTDRVSYNYPQYYGTIRTEVMTIDGQQKLFAMIRQAGGLELHQYDPSINMWQRLAWLTHWTDSVGYNNPQYYETICTEVITINNQQKLLAMIRNASGLQLNLYDPLTNTWQGLATGPAWADSVGYNNPHYYKTIRTNIITINRQQKLLVMMRHASGYHVSLFDPNNNTWQNLTISPPWLDTLDLAKPEYYKTICTEVIHDAHQNPQLVLMMRQYDGFKSWQYDMDDKLIAGLSVYHDAIVNPKLWLSLARQYVRFREDFAEFILDPNQTDLNHIISVGEDNLWHLKSQQNNLLLFDKLFNHYNDALKEMVNILNTNINSQNQVFNQTVTAKSAFNGTVDICHDVNETINIFKHTLPIAQNIKGGNLYYTYSCRYIWLKRGFDDVCDTHQAYAPDLNYNSTVLHDSNQFPFEFCLVERLGLGQFNMHYTRSNDYSHHAKMRQQGYIPPDGEKSYEYDRNIVIEFVYHGAASQVIAANPQQIRTKSQTVTQQYSVDQSLRLDARVVISNYILNLRKTAVKNALSQMESQFQKLDAHLRMLSAYAMDIGCVHEALALLKQLTNANQVASDLNQYIHSATIDTPMPSINTDILIIRNNFLSRLNANNNNELQSQLEIELNIILRQLKILKIKELIANEIVVETPSIQNQNLPDDTLYQTGMSIGNMLALSAIIMGLRAARFNEAALLLEAQNPNIRIMRENEMSAGEKRGFLQALSLKIMEIMPILMEARQFDAVMWLTRFSHEQITRSLTQQGVALQLLGMPERNQQERTPNRHTFFLRPNLPLQQTVANNERPLQNQNNTIY